MIEFVEFVCIVFCFFDGGSMGLNSEFIDFNLLSISRFASSAIDLDLTVFTDCPSFILFTTSDTIFVGLKKFFFCVVVVVVVDVKESLLLLLLLFEEEEEENFEFE